jgi:U-box domain-containing protein 5
MTQPITLPSGKVIDQTTLEKHEQNEAIWGRPLSDPFTCIPFNENHKPVMATALKSRIDKFLLDNSNMNEIKNIPRVLGRESSSALAGNRRIIEVSKSTLNNNLLKRTVEDTQLNICKQVINSDSQGAKRHCHQLPAIVTCRKQSTANANKRLKQIVKNLSSSKSVHNNSHTNKNDKSEVPVTDIDNSLDNNVRILLSNMKRFNTPEKVELHISSNCKCCNNSTFYRLPCNHVICRKVLLSVENNQCKSCGLSYKSSDVERVHDSISNR